MDKPTLYIETSIVSYLASRPSRDPVTARNQQLTHAWWNTRRQDYALYTSRAVLQEVEAGDPAVADRRLALLASVPVVEVETPEFLMAQALQRLVPLPSKAREDALHIATAATRAMTYLLTWDRKYIANPQLEARIRRILLANGYEPPVLCTPSDLMEKK
jgi:predicted nucleic acid-binding protein